MFDKRKIKNRRVTNTILLVTATIGYFVLQIGLDEGSITSWTSISGAICLSLSAIGIALLNIIYKQSVSPRTKTLLTASSERWEHRSSLDANLGFIAPILGAGIEVLFTAVSIYLLALPIGYLVASYLLYRQVRARVIVGPYTTTLMFFVSWSSVIFSIIALRNPQLLQEALAVFSIQSSKSISFLFFPWLQFALVASTALLLTQSWRSYVLVDWGLDDGKLHDLYEEILKKKSDESWIEKFSSVFLREIPNLLSLFEQGNFTTVVSLGWGNVDRGLASVSSRRHIRDRALDIGISESEFDTSYGARTDTVHKGISSSYLDALNVLALMKHIVEHLIEAN